jgi:hypothetical protein
LKSQLAAVIWILGKLEKKDSRASDGVALSAFWHGTYLTLSRKSEITGPRPSQDYFF